MSKKICVYTCITGNYDALHEINHPETEIDYYCFTNNKKIKSNTWKIIYINDKKIDNRHLARKIKILGHPTINQNYETAVWIDADVVWQKPIMDFIKTYYQNSTFSIFKHHSRNNIHDEAIACLRLRKENKENILKILNFYKTVNYLGNNGLCESTVFIKSLKDPLVTKTMQIWFDIVNKYSHRDQLSFNYAISKTNLNVNYINLNVWDNTWFKTAKHIPSTKENTSCHVYFGNPNQNFDINKYYIYEYHKKNHTYFFNATIPNAAKEIELNPTDIIGTKFDNILISPTPNHIIINGTVSSIFCNEHGTIHIYNNFKKGQKLSFSITMSKATAAEINKLIEYQWLQNITLLKENSDLKSTNQEIQKNLQSIINSKGWKTLEKTRKLLHLK